MFGYTETPRIWSPTFSFEITQLVLPSELPDNAHLGQKTRFEFPFNSPKKSAKDAYMEVQQGFEELSETTLLFLSSIESVSWKKIGEDGGQILRISHSKEHVEVLKERDGEITRSSHFLLFSKPVDGLERQHVSIAFELEALPAVEKVEYAESLKKQFRIIPVVPGRVAIFFTADKEQSGLRFHLHAPFVPDPVPGTGGRDF